MVLICLVTFFAIVASVNAIMMRAAISTFGGLETESSYKAGLTFAREIAASEAQQARHWQVTAHLGTIVGGEAAIELSALDAAGQPLSEYNAIARLSHPTDRRLDRAIESARLRAGPLCGRVG